MKRILLPVLVMTALAFLSPGKEKHKMIKGPPGTLFVRDTIFMDIYEVTNLNYREFIDWTKKKYNETEKYITEREMPDTLIWRKFGTYSKDMVDAYFSHPKYSDFPVVGVSHQQAMDYCKWRSERGMELLAEIKNKKLKTEFPSNVASFIYRLPTIKEWELAAFAGLDSTEHPFGFEFLDDTMHIDKVHVKQSYDNVLGMDYGGEPYAVKYALPNPWGFYTMIGNVAEMTGTKGISKGGSYRHYLDESHIRDSLNYMGPEPWLGFRCVCIVKYKTGYDPVNGKKK